MLSYILSFTPPYSKLTASRVTVSLFHSHSHTCEISGNCRYSFKQNTLAALLSDEDTAGNCYFPLSGFIQTLSIIIHMKGLRVLICQRVTMATEFSNNWKTTSIITSKSYRLTCFPLNIVNTVTWKHSGDKSETEI